MKKFMLALWTIVCMVGCASEVTPADGSDAALIIVDSSTPDSAVPTNDASEASAEDATDAQAEASADATPTDAPALPGLTVTLAADPSGLVVAVKKQHNIPSVGLVFTAGPDSDEFVRFVRLTGIGDVSGRFASDGLAQIVTVCALFDGSTQVGLAESPDPVSGAMNVTNVNVRVAAGTSVTLQARCTADSVVAQPGGDNYAIGIATASDVVAEDADGHPSSMTVASNVLRNATTMPVVVVTVRNAGSLTIEPYDMRPSTILVAGGGVWQNLAQYRATARDEGATLTRADLVSAGDAACFTQIAVARDGRVLGTAILPAGDNQSHDVDLSADPIMVPRDSSVVFQLWAQLADVQSSASVGG